MFEGKTYKLANILNHNGRSKIEGSWSDQERYQYWAGCYTNNIRIVTKEYLGETYECLSVHFVADADGNFTDRHLRTSPILKIEAGIGRTSVHTGNSIYVFDEGPLPEPGIREANNLIKLWMTGSGYRFGKGVHYDADGTAHILQPFVYLGMTRDSILVCQRDNPSITVARYFNWYHGVEFYDTICRQQNYDTPMLIHNSSSRQLAVKFQFGGVEHIIKPGEELLIHPPKRPERRTRR